MIDRLDFSLTQLQYFVAAAELGNISAAAEQLHVSQSTLSSAILRLEKQLGCQLFLRHHARGITPTPSGRQLLADARGMLRQARDLQDHSQQLQEEVVGELEVGIFSTMAPVLVPSLLQQAREDYPQLTLNLHENQIDPIMQMLQNGTFELAVTYSLGITEDVEFHPFIERRPHALVPDGHPLAERGQAGLDELSKDTFVMLNLPHLERYMLDLFSRHQIEVPKIITTTSFETMRGLVATGAGFTILMQRTASPVTMHGGRVAPIEITDDVPTVGLGIAMAAGSSLTRRASAFIECCRKVVAKIYGPGEADRPVLNA